MKLVLLIGNGAVGKMTVGQELAKITGLRLFHNHMMIEPVLEIFGQWRPDITQRLRQVIFEEFAKTDNYGMIFTYLCAFDMPGDWEYLDWVKGIFGLPEEDVYYVELIAPQEVRLQRNISENRLKHKSSKRNIQDSNSRLLRDDWNHRCESFPGEIVHPNYLRLENTGIPAAEAARIIKEHFQF